MSAPVLPIHRHLATAKEHLAGLHAAAAWRKELIAAHLLDTQAPIKDTPVDPAKP
jgi:hypothetical protein